MMTDKPDSISPDTLTSTDLALTTDGLEARGAGRVLVIACGALAHEIIALRKQGGWDHMDLTCLPAILHNTPDKITDAVRAAVVKHRPQYETIFVAYADCGTGGLLQAACAEMGVEMIQGPHCYAFFDGVEQFTDRDEIDAFYLTDFLARQFDAFVTKPLGLDRHPELRDMYFEHYTKLVYLSQTEDPALIQKAREGAERLGLDFVHRKTGYGDLRHTLKAVAEKA